MGGAPCAQANRAIPCTSEPKSRAHTMRLPARALGKFQEELNNVASQASCKFQRSTERQCKNGLVEIATNKKVTTCPPPTPKLLPTPDTPPPQGRESWTAVRLLKMQNIKDGGPVFGPYASSTQTTRFSRFSGKFAVSVSSAFVWCHLMFGTSGSPRQSSSLSSPVQCLSWSCTFSWLQINPQPREQRW